MINSSTIVDALDMNIQGIYQDGLQSWDEEYSKVFNLMDSDKQSEKTSYFSGFTVVPVKPEGTAATYDTILPGIPETFTHDTYALGYEITEEAIEDNQKTPETFNKLPNALIRSGMESVETLSFNVLNNGFSTNGYDGVPLFSTAHPTLDGSTQSNRPSTDVDLGVTSLTAALTAIDGFTDERGLKRPMKAGMVLVPSASWAIVNELLDSEYKPYTANNEKNAIQSKTMQGMVGHYITDTDAWFVLSQKKDHRLLFWWRVRMPNKLRTSTDADTTNLKHLLRFRCSAGYDHWFGTYASSGG